MAENHSPLHQFEIETAAGQKAPLFELFGQNIYFTNSSLFMILSLVAVCTFLLLGIRKQSVVPGRWQAMSEMSYQFVASLIKENVGPEGKKFFPLIFTLFMFILFANLLGMLPFSFTVTSHIAVTFALAMLVFLTVIVTGFVKHGLHFFSLFIPSGLHPLLAFLIFPIEIISFLARPISLSIRLAAAMTAGHILLKVIAGFIVMLITAAGLVGGIFAGLLPLSLIVALIGLEIFICFLQAYIFALLTSIYLNDAINLH